MLAVKALNFWITLLGTSSFDCLMQMFYTKPLNTTFWSSWHGSRVNIHSESQLPLDQAVTVVTASYVVNRILGSVLIRVSLIQTSIREYSYV